MLDSEKAFIFLKMDLFSEDKLPTRFNSISTSNDSDVVLWHLRLGHPSFHYLKVLFPKLFINKNPSFFQCETCELAKHHRTSFSILPSKRSEPFSLVHSDVWGASWVSTLS